MGSRGAPTLPDLAGLMDRQVLRLDDVDLAMGSDRHVLSLHEVGGGRLEFDLLAHNPLRDQVPANPEEAARCLYLNPFALDRRNLRRPSKVDVDVLRLEASIDADGTAGPELLREHASLHVETAARPNPFGPDRSLGVQRSARRDVLGLDWAQDLERSAGLDGFRLQAPRDAVAPCGTELLDRHISFEHARACDSSGFRDERPLHPSAPRGLKRDRLDRIAAHRATADYLDRLLAQSRAHSGEVDASHRLADDPFRLSYG